MKNFDNFNEFYIIAEAIAAEICNKYSSQSITTKLTDNFIKENSYYKLGGLTDDVVNMLNGKSNVLLLSMSNLVKNIAKHPNITKEIYLKSIDLINSSDNLFLDKENLKIFKTYNNQLYEIVLKTTKNRVENYMLSIHYSYIRRQKNKNR